MALLLRLLRLSRRHLGPLLAANVCQLAAAGADLALLVLLRRLLDRNPADPGLATMVGLGLGLAVVRAAAASYGARLAQRTSVVLIGDLQNHLYAHIHGLSLDFFQRTTTGDLLARLFHDVETAARLVTGVAVGAVDAVLRLLVLCVALWTLHPPAAVASVVVIVPAAALLHLLGRGLRARFEQLYQELGLLYETARDALAAPELVKSFGREEAEVAGFAAANLRLLAREARLQQLQALEAPLAEALRVVGVAAALLVGGQALAAGTLSVGGMASLLVATWAFWGALEALATAYASAQGGRAAAARVCAVLDETPTVVRPAAPRPALFTQVLRFDDVDFAYPGRGRVLGGLSFEVRRGEHVVLVGASGSGKTTLLRLALRLFDPVRGRVTLDGNDLRDLDPAAVRALFALVPQDTLLLDRSIRDNVAYGCPGAAPAALASALEAAGLDLPAARFPDGVDTLVGSRGVALSAGERQRVGLARAILRDAPILLLDEATSSLDDETAERVQRALDTHAQGRTVLTITHRVERLPAGCRILELAGGRLRDYEDVRPRSRGFTQP